MADLGSLERLVLDHVWRAGEPLLIRDLLDRINAGRTEAPLAYTTVQTVCDRLAAKGIFTRVPAGRANRYEAVWTREEYVARLMVDALGDVDDRDSVFARFVEMVDGRDAQRLRAALEGRRPKRR